MLKSVWNEGKIKSIDTFNNVVYNTLKSTIKDTIKFLKKHRGLLSKYEKVIRLLEVDPLYPSLRLHQLKGKLYPLYSVSIDIQYRMTMEFFIEDGKIILVDIGTHDDVYP